MEEGGLLYCHTTGHMEGNGQAFAYAGGWYEIERIEGNTVAIHSECGPDHYWQIDDPSFEQHFSIEKRKRNSWDGSTIKFNFV